MILLHVYHMLSYHHIVLKEGQTPLPTPVVAFTDVLSALFDKVTEGETERESCALNYYCLECPENES